MKPFGNVEFYCAHGVAVKITMDGKNFMSVGKEGTDFAIVTESLSPATGHIYIADLNDHHKNLEF